MKCPSCYEALADNATHCDCGWRRPAKATPDKEAVDSMGRELQCSFMLDADERCRNGVSWFPGGSRKGFCSKHVRLDDPGIPCPPEIRERIQAFLHRTNVTPGRVREPGEEG